MPCLFEFRVALDFTNVVVTPIAGFIAPLTDRVGNIGESTSQRKYGRFDQLATGIVVDGKKRKRHPPIVLVQSKCYHWRYCLFLSNNDIGMDFVRRNVVSIIDSAVSSAKSHTDTK